MNTQFDSIIVGGGLIGPLLACALGQAGVKIAIADALPAKLRKSPKFDGRAYSLSLTSIRMLKTLGIWDEVAEHAQPINDIKVSHGTSGQGASPFFVHFDHREIEEGPFGHMLEDRFLRAALYDKLSGLDNVDVFDNHELVAINSGDVTLRGPRGGEKTLSASLSIGCDGRNSKLAQLCGIERVGWQYDQKSLVCAVEHERPHNGVAHQYFSQSGPLAILPLPGGTRSTIVWTDDKDAADRVHGSTDAAYLATLQPVFGDFLGQIELIGDRYIYPLGLSLASAFVADRAVLAGDAAHGIHPLAGQGLNLGIRDVAALAETVIDAQRRGEDIGSTVVLERYQSWRRFDVAMMAAATDVINKAFLGRNPIMSIGRDLAFQALSATPALRRAFMRNAAGLNGELPRLLSGRSL